MISDQNCTTRSSVSTLLQPFWNRRIQSVPIFYWSSSRFVKKGTQKGGYISFCIRNRNDLIWYRAKMGQFTEHEWRDLEQMWFRAKNSVIFELITLLRANQNCRDHQWFQNGYIEVLKKGNNKQHTKHTTFHNCGLKYWLQVKAKHCTIVKHIQEYS